MAIVSWQNQEESNQGFVEHNYSLAPCSYLASNQEKSNQGFVEHSDTITVKRHVLVLLQGEVFKFCLTEDKCLGR